MHVLFVQPNCRWIWNSQNLRNCYTCQDQKTCQSSNSEHTQKKENIKNPNPPYRGFGMDRHCWGKSESLHKTTLSKVS